MKEVKHCTFVSLCESCTYTHNINLIAHMNHTRVIVLVMYKRSNESASG